VSGSLQHRMAQSDARPTVDVADYRNATSERKRRLYDRV